MPKPTYNKTDNYLEEFAARWMPYLCEKKLVKGDQGYIGESAKIVWALIEKYYSDVGEASPVQLITVQTWFYKKEPPVWVIGVLRHIEQQLKTHPLRAVATKSRLPLTSYTAPYNGRPPRF